LRFAIYSADLTSQLCLSAVATGSKVESTGAQTIGWASGANVSGGTCTIAVGNAVAFLMTTDDTTLAISVHGSLLPQLVANVGGAGTARKAGYNSSTLSTGSGSSLAFATVSGVSWTAIGAFNALPVIYLEN